MEENKHLFVTCLDGLESLLSQELQEMGFSRVKEGFRGVYVEESSLRAVYLINYTSRLASRVLLPILRFRCYDRDSLYRAVEEIDWTRYIPRGKTFAIDANVTHPNLNNSLFTALVAKDAVCDRYRKETGSRPNVCVSEPDIQLNLYIQQTHAVLSVDTSGVPLHKRGYRQGTSEAPINETLAAALLKIAKLDEEDVLYDPCCGSATFLIEAALSASRIPPGFLRKHWGFMYLPQFSLEEWLQVKRQADELRKPFQKGKWFGSEVNRSTVTSALTNLRAAGLNGFVQISHADFREYVSPKPPTLLISNPPHGRRMENVEGLRPLYRSLGNWMKQQLSPSARGFIFTGSSELAKEIGLAPTRRHVVVNSGVDSRFLEYAIY